MSSLQCLLACFQLSISLSSHKSENISLKILPSFSQIFFSYYWPIWKFQHFHGKKRCNFWPQIDNSLLNSWTLAVGYSIMLSEHGAIANHDSEFRKILLRLYVYQANYFFLHNEDIIKNNEFTKFWNWLLFSSDCG